MRRLALCAMVFASVTSAGCAAAVVTAATAAPLVGIYYLTKGGAMSEKNLRRETGRILNLDPDRVSVSNVERGALQVAWKATTPEGSYKCNADDMVRRPSCIKE